MLCWELEVTPLSKLSFKWKVGALLNKIVRAFLMHDHVMLLSLVTGRRIKFEVDLEEMPTLRSSCGSFVINLL